MNRILLVAFLLLSIGNLFAQSPFPCGTAAEKSAWLREYQQHPELFQQRSGDTAWLYVPLTVHILGDDNGSGYFQADKTFQALCELNADYAPSRIRYYLTGTFDYINKTEWYSHKTFGPGAQMMNQSNFPDCLNSYIVADPAGNCGYYSGQQDGVALSKGCVGTGDNTWAHELGHNLSLPHPFFGWEGHNNYPYNKPAPTDWDGWEVEKMDGSNCHSAADGFCDTPPDYLNYRWECGPDSYSIKQQLDPDSIPFFSDGSFYMSYSYDQCSNRFSHEQTKAMRTNLQDERADILYTTAAGPEIPGKATAELVSPINGDSAQFDKAHLVWKPVAGAEFYHVWVSLYNVPNARFFQTLLPATATYVDVPVALPLGKTYRWVVTPYSTWDFCAPDSTIIGKFVTNNTVATSELERTADIKIMPNPASVLSGTGLSISAAEGFTARLDVVDFSGKTIYSRANIAVSDGENSIEIPLGDIAAGIYSVVLRTEKGTATRRLVVVD